MQHRFQVAQLLFAYDNAVADSDPEIDRQRGIVKRHRRLQLVAKARETARFLIPVRAPAARIGACQYRIECAREKDRYTINNAHTEQQAKVGPAAIVAAAVVVG